MELSLPAVNTTQYQLMRDRYDCGGGTYGLNVVFQAGTPYLIVFISDTDRYEDQSENETLFYEFQDQVYNQSGNMKKHPKPLGQFGPQFRNRTVVEKMASNGGILPCIIIAKQSHNQWHEICTDAVCRGVSVASDGVHYFRVERSRVPYWFLGPVVDEEEE
jgi:hypothetical protein